MDFLSAVGALKDRDNELFRALKAAGELEILGFHGAGFFAFREELRIASLSSRTSSGMQLQNAV
jgi:hypothetical protein